MPAHLCLGKFDLIDHPFAGVLLWSMRIALIRSVLVVSRRYDVCLSPLPVPATVPLFPRVIVIVIVIVEHPSALASPLPSRTARSQHQGAQTMCLRA